VNEPRLSPGTLWPAAAAATARARAAGALHTIATRPELVEEQGIPFLVRVLASGAGRAALQQKQVNANIDTPAGVQQAPAFDPFLPYDPAMFVADLSPTHVCLLNKFNVIDHHLLIVTRAYADQDQALTAADFSALWACMAEIDGFAFYNGGKAAGASQRHKHLQLAPLPWGPGSPRLPLEDALHVDELTPEPCVRMWPYVHAALRLDEAWLEGDARAGAQLARAYRALLAQFDINSVGDNAVLPPYNLLCTRRWMVLVPRRRELWEDIAVNALGFGGSLLVRSDAQLAHLRVIGPLAVLRAVGMG
jgi:ATP adenylyltransferase